MEKEPKSLGTVQRNPLFLHSFLYSIYNKRDSSRVLLKKKCDLCPRHSGINRVLVFDVAVQQSATSCSSKSHLAIRTRTGCSSDRRCSRFFTLVVLFATEHKFARQWKTQVGLRKEKKKKKKCTAVNAWVGETSLFMTVTEMKKGIFPLRKKQ